MRYTFDIEPEDTSPKRKVGRPRSCTSEAVERLMLDNVPERKMAEDLGVSVWTIRRVVREQRKKWGKSWPHRPPGAGLHKRARELAKLVDDIPDDDGTPETAVVAMRATLWRTMREGGFDSKVKAAQALAELVRHPPVEPKPERTDADDAAVLERVREVALGALANVSDEPPDPPQVRVDAN